jgi:hypothetical protein
VKHRNGQIVNTGMKTTLFELRTMGRAGWKKFCPGPAYFIPSRETGKVSHHWKPAYRAAESGREKGAITNPDTGCAIPRSEGGYLSGVDFAEKKIFEHLTRGKDGTAGFPAIWRPDRQRIRRLQSIYYGGRSNRALLQENFPANVEIQTEH